MLDAGASKAFAVADHQVAHIYINDVSIIKQVRSIVEKIQGVELILDRSEQSSYHINHGKAEVAIIILLMGQNVASLFMVIKEP